MKLDLIEQLTKNCDVCSAETDPEDAFCQECGTSLSQEEPEPLTFTAKLLLTQKKLSASLPRITSIPGIPKLPTAVPALIGMGLFVGAVTWCIRSIDTSFDTFSEDYVASAAQKAIKLLLRFHLEHSGKMSADHLLMLGQFLVMRAAEATETRDYSTAINYLKKVPKDCPQYAAAQTKLRYLKDLGLTVTAPTSPVVAAPPLPVQTQINHVDATNATGTKVDQPSLVAPQVVPEVGQQIRSLDTQENKLQTSIPIWQRFSHGVTANKTRLNVGSGAGNSGSSFSPNAGTHADRESTGAEGKINDNDNIIEAGSEGRSVVESESESERVTETVNTSQVKSSAAAASTTVTSSALIHPAYSTSGHQIAENERDKPKVSGFFIDGKAVSPDSRSQEPEKNPEKVTEAARSAGPKSHPVVGQKSYNPNDISRYNELLANYFSQHDASPQKSTDKHVGGAEPPSFQEWISKGRPGFR
jgi:hypothetical protein